MALFYLALCILHFVGVGVAVDCAMKDFDGALYSNTDVHCAVGYHHCYAHPKACCSDVQASPVELALVILGPTSMVLSAALLGFVIYISVKQIQEEKTESASMKKNKVAPMPS